MVGSFRFTTDIHTVFIQTGKKLIILNVFIFMQRVYSLANVIIRNNVFASVKFSTFFSVMIVLQSDTMSFREISDFISLFPHEDL